MSLTHQHYQLLIAAARKAFGADFHRHLARVRQLEREDMLDLSVELNPSFRPEPLAVRMGLDERAGLALAAELRRYGYVEHEEFSDWTVTADGLEAAVAYQRLVAKGAGAKASSTPPSRKCGRCGHGVIAQIAKFCPRCGLSLPR